MDFGTWILAGLGAAPLTAMVLYLFYLFFGGLANTGDKNNDDKGDN